MLQAIGGQNYRALDIDPSRYAGLPVERFDLCRDSFDLPPESCDLIVHNHVLEHIECNYTAVLTRLAHALTATGTMLFSVPILSGHFSDELVKAPLEQKIARFGSMLHVRRFGRDFVTETIGMIFRIPERYDLTASFSEAELEEANIPPRHWQKYTGASIFRVQRADLRL